MENSYLSGFDVLVLEDEPLIMLDMKCALEHVGARVHCARRLSEAIVLLETTRISAAVLDYLLADGTADDLCKELKQRSIPYAIYSGYDLADGTCAESAILPKPSSVGQLQKMVRDMCADNAARNSSVANR